jgi:hypothetical protein
VPVLNIHLVEPIAYKTTKLTILSKRDGFLTVFYYCEHCFATRRCSFIVGHERWLTQWRIMDWA